MINDATLHKDLNMHQLFMSLCHGVLLSDFARSFSTVKYLQATPLLLVFVPCSKRCDANQRKRQLIMKVNYVFLSNVSVGDYIFLF